MMTTKKIVPIAATLLVFFGGFQTAEARTKKKPAEQTEEEKPKSGEAPSPAEEMEAKMAEWRTEQSPVPYRRNFDDKQDAAARPKDFTLDPQYRGFIPIPRTIFMVKFNPKPRVDLTLDSDNSGNDFRFVPAFIPVEGAVNEGGGARFNANGNGTQLRVDVRAPSAKGNLRFFYQNDF